MTIILGTINRSLIVAAISTFMAIAAAPSSTCPRLCKCITEKEDLTIICSDLRLDNFPVDIPTTIKSLDVSSNVISIVSDKDLGQFKLLKYLDISSNNIQDLPTDTFSPLTLLKTLDLSFNNITRFHPSIFINNRNLEHLSIRGNPLQIATDSSILVCESLKTLELDLDTWSKHTFKNLTSLEQLTVHWKKGISLNKSTFENLYRLTEINLICTGLCDGETAILSPDLKQYLTTKRVNITYNRTTVKQSVGRKYNTTIEESGHNKEITQTSSQQQGADEERDDSLHNSESVAAVTPAFEYSLEEMFSQQNGSSLTWSNHQTAGIIEYGEILKNTFSGRDSGAVSQSFVRGTDVDKEQTLDSNENNMQIGGHGKIIFAANGIIIILLILILTLILCIALCCYRQSREKVCHNASMKPIPGNAHIVERGLQYYEHVYDEPKDVDSRLFYHIYYDHNAPLLPPRPQLGPPVPPRPVGYYAVPYEGERR